MSEEYFFQIVLQGRKLCAYKPPEPGKPETTGGCWHILSDREGRVIPLKPLGSPYEFLLHVRENAYEEAKRSLRERGAIDGIHPNAFFWMDFPEYGESWTHIQPYYVDPKGIIFPSRNPRVLTYPLENNIYPWEDDDIEQRVEDK